MPGRPKHARLSLRPVFSAPPASSSAVNAQDLHTSLVAGRGRLQVPDNRKHTASMGRRHEGVEQEIQRTTKGTPAALLTEGLSLDGVN